MRGPVRAVGFPLQAWGSRTSFDSRDGDNQGHALERACGSPTRGARVGCQVTLETLGPWSRSPARQEGTGAGQSCWPPGPPPPGDPLPPWATSTFPGSWSPEIYGW